MIRVAVERTNPGQFFACCGLLELADRLWNGAEGWFEERLFCIRPVAAAQDATSANLALQLAKSRLSNTMTPEQESRLTHLSGITAKERAKKPGLDEEKKSLEKLRREAPLHLHAPFDIRMDWFLDTLAGGSRFKTWAGQQSVLEIASSMKSALASPDWQTQPSEDWLSRSSSDCGLPFNFDSDLGGQGSALDVGFSFDPLAGSSLTRIESTARPFLEFLAFVGLQRFRPRQVGNDNRYLYCSWKNALPVELAAPTACGLMPMANSSPFEFSLLYRTKYLKSFLPAIPYVGDSDE